MNYNLNNTLNMNERMKKKNSIPFRTRTKSMHSQKSTINHANKEELPNQTKSISVFEKLKKVFSSRNTNENTSLQTLDNQNKNEKNIINQSNGNINGNISMMNNRDRTKLITNNPNNLNTSENFHNLDLSKNSCIEWQPVFHETCQIKLPVDDINKVKIPEESIDEWIKNNSQLNKNKPKLNDNNTQISEEKINDSKNDCSINTKLSQSSCMGTNKDEPYTKFKYYYNYYLVDEYLDSLAESENKKRDLSDLNEDVELYDNLNLNIKPILTTKERLESGVPYDPKNLLI